ncbi:Nop6 protein [Pichia kluyveri]|uniref:Nop6 protein n=1 Tax=Pichia kluyveri TaxID=36015 RepID=A0AAV5R9M5_PICKL|nr:Nop6 protein [Pichia kluyveri]
MTEEVVEKLSKKQLKALKFKSKTSTNAAEELKTRENLIQENEKRKREEEIKEQEAAEAKAKADAEAPPKKKRKTRRGKKHRGDKEKEEGPRFILFVGNLPFKITEEDINTHFKNCKPSNIRLRQDKGCAFVEFKNEDPKESKRLMDIALRLHKSVLGGRKINVELTAGGGGNSKDRVEKIKAKNDKLEQERLNRLQAEKDKKAKAEADKRKANGEDVLEGGVHPDRAKMLGL